MSSAEYRKNVIFDFDGTLADSLEKVVDLLYEETKKTRYSLTKGEIYDYFRNKPLKEIIKEFNFSMFHISYIVWKIRREIRKYMVDEIKPFKNTASTLAYLRSRGYNIYLLTSNNKENVERFIKKYHMDYFQDKFFKSSLFGKEKSLNKIIKKKSLDKENTVYVGDEIRDIEACRKVGINVISATYGYNSKEILKKENPDYMIDDISKIKEILI